MGLVLKICGNNWRSASRDKRELAVYRELGYDVLVMAKGESGQLGRDEVDGFRILRCSTRPFGRCFKRVGRGVALLQWAWQARKLRPTVISGHDLLPGLVIAWLSTWFQYPKPKLIYDAHEFELGRNTVKKRGKILRWLLAPTEKFLMKRCAFSIMVNDSIADEVQKNYKLSERPIVVRSTPDNWQIDREACRRQREAYLNAFQSVGDRPSSDREEKGTMKEPFIVMYHGSLTNGRGIEALINLVFQNSHVNGVILGDGNARYVSTLKEMADRLGVSRRVIFHPAVPIDDLWRYVGAVDLSLMMIEGKAKSYYLSLPNKFFESIQAMTPIVASDFPEMKRLIDRYQIGLTCSPDDADGINRCVEKMRIDSDFYEKCKTNLKKAKVDLCWENEKKVLEKAFIDMI